MAVLHIDDFNGYGTNAGLLLAGMYSRAGHSNISGGGITIVADPDGVSPGRVLRMPADYGGGGNHQVLRKPLPEGPVNVIGVVQRVWCENLPHIALNFRPMVLEDGSNNTLFYLNITATGALEIRNGANALLYTTALPVITAQGWWHIEWKTVIDDTNGSFEVRVEGIPKIDESNIDTGVTSVSQVSIINDPDNASAGDTFFVKDYTLWDDSGTEITDFVGTCILFPHDLTADVALNWGVSEGVEGYTILNNDPPDVGQYIYAEDSPLPDAYVASISALPDDIVSVKAVALRYMLAKNDGGDAKVQAGLIASPDDSPATFLGAERPATIAQTFYQDINHLNPKTAAPWLPVDLSAAHVEMNRTL